MATITIDDLHPDLVVNALRLLDGPALASATCTTMHLRSLAAHSDVWRNLCLSTWPSLWCYSGLIDAVIASFPDSHRSFFSQAYPFPFLSGQGGCVVTIDDSCLPGELISCVDVFYNGAPIFSRVVVTRTSGEWFLGSPFQIDALDRKDPGVMDSPPVISPAELMLSWIVVDPTERKAVNLSSRRPVAVERRWYTEENTVHFAMATEDGSPASVVVLVTCVEETGHVREVSLMLEDEDGTRLNGKESLVIMKKAMEGIKRGTGRGEEEVEVKRRYEKHMRRRKEKKESRARREMRINTGCMAVGAFIFLEFMFLVVFR